MSVRPEFFPVAPSLAGSEGELVNVHVCVSPRHLERLLEILASLSFPINPQIYHQAGLGRVYPDGREQVEHATIVEFPAFSDRLSEVCDALRQGGLPRECAHVRAMLDDIHADFCTEAAPRGAEYTQIRYYKHLPTASGASTC